MRVQVVLKATDLLNGEEKILADGPAIYQDDVLLYQEKDTGAKHRISFKEDLVIERKADVNSTTVLKNNAEGETKVESAYGVMKLRTFCHYQKHENNIWKAEYSVYSGNEQVLFQRLEWTFYPVC